MGSFIHYDELAENRRINSKHRADGWSGDGIMESKSVQAVIIAK